MGRALNRRATRAAHFNGVVQLALGVDRFRGALELPETWEIVGPTRLREHLSQSAYANRLRHPRRPSEPVTAIRLEHSVSLDTRFCRKSRSTRFRPGMLHVVCDVNPSIQSMRIKKTCSESACRSARFLALCERPQIEDLIERLTDA